VEPSRTVTIAGRGRVVLANGNFSGPSTEAGSPVMPRQSFARALALTTGGGRWYGEERSWCKHAFRLSCGLLS
jgi:hypothetical protein